MTFSIGTTPATASPAVTASNTPRKLASAVRGTSPNAARTASSANAPGSPAYATGPSGAGMARSVVAGGRPGRHAVRQAAGCSSPCPESSAKRSIGLRSSVVAKLEHGLEMVRRLDALGHDPMTASPGERAKRLEHGLGRAVGRARANEREVDLEDVELDLTQEAETRVAGTDIVDGDTDLVPAQGRDRLLQTTQV